MEQQNLEGFFNFFIFLTHDLFKIGTIKMLKNVVKMVQTFGMSLKSAIENFQFMGLRILSELSGYGVKLEYRSIQQYYFSTKIVNILADKLKSNATKEKQIEKILKIIGDLMCGGSFQIDQLLHLGIFEHITKKIESNNITIVQYSLWIIGLVASQKDRHMCYQQSIANYIELIAKVVQFLDSDNEILQIEAAYTIISCFEDASSLEIHQIINQGGLKLIEYLSEELPNELKIAIFQCLYTILLQEYYNDQECLTNQQKFLLRSKVEKLQPMQEENRINLQQLLDTILND